jgi:hypothetical protein
LGEFFAIIISGREIGFTAPKRASMILPENRFLTRYTTFTLRGFTAESSQKASFSWRENKSGGSTLARATGLTF